MQLEVQIIESEMLGINYIQLLTVFTLSTATDVLQQQKINLSLHNRMRNVGTCILFKHCWNTFLSCTANKIVLDEHHKNHKYQMI